VINGISGGKNMGAATQERHEKLGPVALKILTGYVVIMLVGFLAGGLF
jgi:hypothetical protein